MRFSILQLLIGTAIVGAILGMAVRDGLIVGVWLTILVTFFGICVTHARSGWSKATWLQKTYALIATSASGLLLAGVIYAVGTSADLANKRNTRNLQVAFAHDRRFADVYINYNERKGGSLWVEGAVSTEDDFKELRECLHHYDWSGTNGIHWYVSVSKPKQIYSGWDQDLFGEEKH